MGMEELVNRRLSKVGDGNIYAYEFLEKLGKGGFGEVWKVRRDGKEYALKAPLNTGIRPGYLPSNVEYPNLEMDPKLIEREAKTWARLTDMCPEAVICLQDFNIDPFPWMLMELAETDLNTELNKGKADTSDFCELLIKLQQIHDIDVIHRDIKPCNILRVNGEWKFSDFGLSKVLSGTSSRMGYGTPHYMAPEQVWHKEYGDTSKKTDIWAMGIMLMRDFLELEPYPDSNLVTIYSRIVMEGPDTSEIDDAIRPALERTFEKEQEYRIKSSMEFLAFMPHDSIPERVKEELGISGIHPIDEGYDQYWTYDSKNKTMTVYGQGGLKLECPDGLDCLHIDIKHGITAIKCSDSKEDGWIPALESYSSIQTINIPDSVTSIGEWALAGCSSIQSIDIPDGVTSIEACAFLGCSSLQSIKIPDGVTSIGASAFQDCSSLKSIKIPDGVTSIGAGAFLGCSSLQSIDIPDGVTSIDDETFYGCSSLQSIKIPDGVTSIGKSAFKGCTSLQSIEIPYYCEYADDSFDEYTNVYRCKKTAFQVKVCG